MLLFLCFSFHFRDFLPRGSGICTRRPLVLQLFHAQTGRVYSTDINPLAPGTFQFNFRLVVFKLILVNGGWGISYEIALRWLPLDLTDDKSTLVQVMALCHQATSHYLSECWPRSMSPNGVTRPQWVNISALAETQFGVNLLKKILFEQYCELDWCTWCTEASGGINSLQLVESLRPTRGSMRFIHLFIHFGPNIDLTVADGRLLSCEVDDRPLALLAHALNFTFLWCLFYQILFHLFHLPVKLVSESIVRCFH